MPQALGKEEDRMAKTLPVIREADLLDTHALLDMAWKEFDGLTPFEASRSTIAQSLASLIVQSEGILLVAEVDGARVGWIAGIVGQISVWSPARIAQELMLFVLPEHRRAGIGRDLLKAFEAWAKEAGAVAITLTEQAGLDGEATGRLYASLGYRPQEQVFAKPLAV